MRVSDAHGSRVTLALALQVVPALHFVVALLLQRVRAGTFQALKEVDDALTGGSSLPGGAIRAALLQPRTIGITLGAEF